MLNREQMNGRAGIHMDSRRRIKGILLNAAVMSSDTSMMRAVSDMEIGAEM